MEEQNQLPTQPMSSDSQQSTSKQPLMVGAAIAVVAAGAIGYKLMNNQKTMDDGAKETTAQSETTQTPKSFKDGTYEVTGSYTSPAGPEEIGVKVTLKDNLISDVAVTPKATNKFSVKWQGAFADNYKAMVVGKDIDTLKLVQAVAGSSLTPKGFNDAIEKIKAQAT